MYNNIIITAANSPYYYSLLTLISSIHKTSISIVDKIFVYNLGLANEEINTLSKLKNVIVINFVDEDKNSHPKFMEPKSHVYKIYCMKHALNLGHNILWIDAGAMFLKSCDTIFNIIKNNNIFIVGDTHKNKSYTHDNCKNIMQATEEELEDKQLSAGIFGYSAFGKYIPLIEKAYEYNMIPGCVDGDQQNHRHDQSVLSILASRYKISRQDIDIYGYWTDHSRNLNTAISHGSVIFVHRRGHIDYKDLVYEN